MPMFRPLIRYADFRGRASRSEYWLFAVMQGLWYTLLLGLCVGAMGSGESAQATPGVLIAFGLIMLSLAALVVPNYAVLVRRLHDSGRGAIWLCLILPGLLSSVMTVGTIVTAVGAVGAGASREAFVGTVLAGLGAAGVLSLIGMICQAVLFVLTLLPGTHGPNRFGSDPRDPHAFDGGGASGGLYDDDRMEALIAQAKRDREGDYKPVFDFGPGPQQAQPRMQAHEAHAQGQPQFQAQGRYAAQPEQAAPPPAQPDWGRPAWDPGVAPSRPFGRRGG